MNAATSLLVTVGDRQTRCDANAALVVPTRIVARLLPMVSDALLAVPRMSSVARYAMSVRGPGSLLYQALSLRSTGCRPRYTRCRPRPIRHTISH